MNITITVNTDNLSFSKLDTAPGPELRMVAEQAINLVLLATNRLAHLPHTDIRPLFDSDGVKCGAVTVE